VTEEVVASTCLDGVAVVHRVPNAAGIHVLAMERAALEFDSGLIARPAPAGLQRGEPDGRCVPESLAVETERYLCGDPVLAQSIASVGSPTLPFSIAAIAPVLVPRMLRELSRREQHRELLAPDDDALHLRHVSVGRNLVVLVAAIRL
jgi:hypothetical protein